MLEKKISPQMKEFVANMTPEMFFQFYNAMGERLLNDKHLKSFKLGITDEIEAFISQGKHIDAIRCYRSVNSSSLTDAKNACDDYRQFLRVTGKMTA
jgi:hypothetical protein